MSAIFTATTYRYQEAQNLIDRLNSEGIRASFTVGGVMVCPEPQDVIKAQSICKELGASFDCGYGGDDVSETAQRVHGNARSVLKEWL